MTSRPNDRSPATPAPADELAALGRWLAAEAADAAEGPAGGTEASRAAEAALGALFAALPRPAPAPGLAGRVLAAARPPRVRETAAQAVREALRRLVHGPAETRGRLVPRLAAALLVAAGTAAALVVGLVGPLAGRLTPAAAIRGAAEAPFALAAAIGRWASAVLDVLETVLHLAGAVATAATTGPVAGSLTASLLVAALSFAVLHKVFEPDRSLSHASHAHLR